tara:strand:+ start:4626 stop:4802 length:177 start_codon:yes stop_codon:yes gene_type:complete
MEQIFDDDELGKIKFIDKKEAHHSVKCRVGDIKLTSKVDDRTVTARLKRDIVEDINGE